MASLIKWYIDKKVEKFLNRGKKYRNESEKQKGMLKDVRQR